MMKKRAVKYAKTRANGKRTTWKTSRRQRMELSCTKGAKRTLSAWGNQLKPEKQRNSNKLLKTRRSLPSCRKRRESSKVNLSATMLSGRQKWQWRRWSFRLFVRSMKGSSRCSRWALWQTNGSRPTKWCTKPSLTVSCCQLFNKGRNIPKDVKKIMHMLSYLEPMQRSKLKKKTKNNDHNLPPGDWGNRHEDTGAERNSRCHNGWCVSDYLRAVFRRRELRQLKFKVNKTD